MLRLHCQSRFEAEFALILKLDAEFALLVAELI
ncbi:Unannotated [Lentimonas sp. CC19]|nr:Unannotated [Lentimonas sp. CC4]CAA6686078.1 Unannotated [Lentimonas sp. CC6]CAA6691925.1 Unannotated [Lentimonas sp. CC10]CAA6697652.1 Unannotated [Lentimonas sp. CC19]CAA7071484.1 Unannotated [Lentimonas sp. CC11]CAA7168455.1 Unannotated [Lentimonas sp. CC21]CAA7182977.1 Unannotated [Lentimonas sp. CC8]